MELELFRFFVDWLAELSPLLTKSYFGIRGAGFLAAIVIFVALYGIFRAFQWLLVNRLKAWAKTTKTDLDDILLDVVGTLRPGFYAFLAFYIASQVAGVSGVVESAINIVLTIWAVYQVVAALQVGITHAVKRIAATQEGNSVGAVRFAGRLTRWVVWMLAVLFVLSNLGVDVTSFVAGLGIGGVAIALAVQNILSDLFSSFAIFFDKPFEVGDFIVAGSHSGIVERIGIKTTRLRALQGEEIVISNKELTSARVQNFKKLQERRVVLSVGVTYDTAQEKLERIPAIIKEVVEGLEDVRFDRAHLASLGDSALLFEAVYYLESDNYVLHMDRKQSLLLELNRAFTKEGIEFAFPSQTIYLSQ